jgi:Protein of unknown function (DUF1761)
MQMLFSNDVLINWVGVGLAALAYFILGLIWYAPLVFGCRWKTAEWEIMSKNQIIASLIGYFGEMIIGLIIAYVLAIFIHLTHASQWHQAILVALWVWIGFIATVQFSFVLWGRKTFKNFLIHTGFMLMSLLMMSIILIHWY